MEMDQKMMDVPEMAKRIGTFWKKKDLELMNDGKNIMDPEIRAKWRKRLCDDEAEIDRLIDRVEEAGNLTREAMLSLPEWPKRPGPTDEQVASIRRAYDLVKVLWGELRSFANAVACASRVAGHPLSYDAWDRGFRFDPTRKNSKGNPCYAPHMERFSAMRVRFLFRSPRFAKKRKVYDETRAKNPEWKKARADKARAKYWADKAAREANEVK